MNKFPWIFKFIPTNWVSYGRNSGVKEISTQAFPLQFKASPALWAEPAKKKKKIDPNILKTRLERKKKKMMKEIKKLERIGKTLKPVEDLEVPECIKEDFERRKRVAEVSQEVSEERIILLKDWTRIKLRESISDSNIIWRFMKAQKKALDELRLESEELYQAAVQIDPKLIPVKYTGPKETPRKENYLFPDGTYTDVTRKWV